jgi:hypothetical protein
MHHSGEETVTSALLAEMPSYLGLRSQFLSLARERKQTYF